MMHGKHLCLTSLGYSCDTCDYMIVSGNVIGWLGDQLAYLYGDTRLDGIPAVLEHAKERLPEPEYLLLEELVGL